MVWLVTWWVIAPVCHRLCSMLDHLLRKESVGTGPSQYLSITQKKSCSLAKFCMLFDLTLCLCQHLSFSSWLDQQASRSNHHGARWHTYTQSKVMPFCDLHDGRTELWSDLPKRSHVRWESWALYQTPASLLGSVAESKLKEKTLSVFLSCYKGSLTFIFSVKPYYVQTWAVRKGVALEQKVSCLLVPLCIMQKYWRPASAGSPRLCCLLPDTVGCH